MTKLTLVAGRYQGSLIRYSADRLCNRNLSAFFALKDMDRGSISTSLADLYG